MNKILQFHEVEWIYALTTIAARKNNITVPKMKAISMAMQNFKHPVCRIVVEEEE